MKAFPFLAALFAATLFATDQNVLIVTGQNNHEWQSTTPKLARLLETTGGFRVAVCDDASKLNANSFEGVDLVVSNWNAYPAHGIPKEQQPDWSKTRETMWSPQTRAALEAAIRSGMGFVVVHAGSSSAFADWPAWREFTLGTYVAGTTFHKMRGPFTVIPAAGHPVSEGLSPMPSSNDEELWNHVVVTNPAAQAVFFADAGGNVAIAEPGRHISALAADFGKGRCFATFLGHNAPSMDETFKTVFVRGCQWACGQTPTYLPKASNARTNELNYAVVFEELYRRKPAFFSAWAKQWKDLSDRARCALTATAVRHKDPRGRAWAAELAQSPDPSIFQFGLTQYAATSTDADYPFFAQQAARGKHVALRAASLVKADNAAEKILSLYQNAATPADRHFYLGLLALQPGTAPLAPSLFEEAMAARDKIAIYALGDMADESIAAPALQKLSVPDMSPDMANAVASMLARLCDGDEAAYRAFSAQWDGLSPLAQERALWVLPAGSGPVEIERLSAHIDSPVALKVLARWKNGSAFPLLLSLLSSDKADHAQVFNTALALSKNSMPCSTNERAALKKIAEASGERRAAFENSKLLKR